MRAPSLLSLSLVLLTPAIAPAQVSGTVRDAVTLEPLAGALVSVQASSEETYSIKDGSFELPAAAGSLKITGAKRGYFNAGVAVDAPASGIDVLLERVPGDDHAGYAFLAPIECSGCHEEQFAQWFDSPMAKAGLNTWVYDIYDGTGTTYGDGGFVYVRDSVHAADDPASECRSCHQPEPWVADPFSALGDITQPTDGMMHGVSCEICHKIADIDESKPSFPGIYPGVVTLSRPSDPDAWQVQYGVLGDVDYTSEVMRAAYQPQLRAAVCAACHEDTNDPDGDGDFEESNSVSSEPTYREWLASPYSNPRSPRYATCVDCHMKPVQSNSACNLVFHSPGRPLGDVRSHRILGTSPEYLDNAVTLALETSLTGDAIEARVSVTNDATGHHVPTGVTIRNVILLVDAWREQDSLPLEHTGTQTVHELGGVGDPADGYYAGLPGKLYAKVNHGADGKGPVFFTDATGIELDNRIPALATDATRYEFALPPGGGTVRVRARLIYRRSWRFLVDAKRWTEDGHGNPLEDVAPPHYGHLMEEEEATVETGAFVDGGADGGGGADSGAGPRGGGAGTDDGGCGCSVPGRRSGPALPWLLVIAIAAAAASRRSRIA